MRRLNKAALEREMMAFEAFSILRHLIGLLAQHKKSIRDIKRTNDEVEISFTKPIIGVWDRNAVPYSLKNGSGASALCTASWDEDRIFSFRYLDPAKSSNKNVSRALDVWNRFLAGLKPKTKGNKEIFILYHP